MSESTNALPLDDSFWEHTHHLDFKVAVALDNGRFLNIVNALESIYELIKKGKHDDAAYFTTGLAATLVASKYGKSQDILNEMIVKVFSDDIDKELRSILNEG